MEGQSLNVKQTLDKPLSHSTLFGYLPNADDNVDLQSSAVLLAQSKFSNPAQSTPLQQVLEILQTTQNLAKDRPVCQLVSDLSNIQGGFLTGPPLNLLSVGR